MGALLRKPTVVQPSDPERVFKGLDIAETVLQKQYDWQCLSAMLIGHARVSTGRARRRLVMLPRRTRARSLGCPVLDAVFRLVFLDEPSTSFFQSGSAASKRRTVFVHQRLKIPPSAPIPQQPNAFRGEPQAGDIAVHLAARARAGRDTTGRADDRCRRATGGPRGFSMQKRVAALGARLQVVSQHVPLTVGEVVLTHQLPVDLQRCGLGEGDLRRLPPPRR